MTLERPQKNNICSIIVTYNPDTNFPKRIERVTKQVAHIVVVDNNSNGIIKSLLKNLADKKKIDIILNGNNFGIGKALNQGISYARGHNFKWILLLDQDSIITEFMTDTLINIYNRLSHNEKVAIVGSNYIKPNSHRIYFKHKGKDKYDYREIKTVITSGSLMSVSLFNNIGPFREEFFIDGIDHEYCLRARSKGYRIVMALAPLMKHPLGNISMHRVLFMPWIKKTSTNHTPLRRYYMYRNYIILIREYLFKNPLYSLGLLWMLFKVTGVIFIFEKDRVEKIKFIFLGLWDGLTYNMKRQLFNSNI